MKPPLEIQPNKNNTPVSASVIWLHGLGANGHDFEPVVNMLNCPHIRFILPHAPERPVTLNNGHIMPAWYDLFGLSADAQTDLAGIEDSVNTLNALIEQEVKRNIPYHRIVIAGFSQGGAIALHTAIKHPEKLGGLMALSTYLPDANNLNQFANNTDRNTQWYMAHGAFDDVITIDIAKASKQALTQAGYQVAFHTYPMAHEVCHAEIADIEAYLLQQLPIN